MPLAKVNTGLDPAADSRMARAIVALPKEPDPNTACSAGCCPAGECNDPLYLFGQWCRANGFADIFDDGPDRTSLARLDEAIERYAEAHHA